MSATDPAPSSAISAQSAADAATSAQPVSIPQGWTGPVAAPSAAQTPNVVVSDPRVRKVANIIIGALLVVLPTAGILDGSSSAIDFSGWLLPAMAVTSFLAGVFNVAVTVPNIPSGK